jgi:hypothetical protein
LSVRLYSLHEVLITFSLPTIYAVFAVALIVRGRPQLAVAAQQLEAATTPPQMAASIAADRKARHERELRVHFIC